MAAIQHEESIYFLYGYLTMCVQIMEKLQKKKGNKWKLLKVGIVDYRDGIFYGRLFFGRWCLHFYSMGAPGNFIQ